MPNNTKALKPINFNYLTKPPPFEPHKRRLEATLCAPEVSGCFDWRKSCVYEIFRGESHREETNKHAVSEIANRRVDFTQRADCRACGGFFATTINQSHKQPSESSLDWMRVAYTCMCEFNMMVHQINSDAIAGTSRSYPRSQTVTSAF